jgi:hypothetical protein
MSKFQKTVFSKLYRYYCAKLLKKIWISILWFFYAIIVWFSGLKFFTNLLNEADGWQKKLVVFWFISFLQLFVVMLVINPLISYLVGRGLGWEELKKRQLFRIPKITQEEDIKVLIFTPGVSRETVILAKFAAAFTYSFMINFFLITLPLTIYFLVAANLGAIATLSFLLLNGIGLGLVNFCLLVPFLFYQQEGGSFLVYLLCFVFLIGIAASVYFLRETIFQYPLVFCLLSIPFFVLTGYLFFSLYRKKFLKNDLD